MWINSLEQGRAVGKRSLVCGGPGSDTAPACPEVSGDQPEIMAGAHACAYL